VAVIQRWLLRQVLPYYDHRCPLGERGRGPLIYPLRRIQKICHKNAIKTRFSHNPPIPPSKELENDLHLVNNNTV
jgi:hypothetical protein